MNRVRTNPAGRVTAVAALGLLSLAVAGCAGTSQDSAALAQARAAYGTAASDPQVAGNAPLELRHAEETLRQAEALQAQEGGTAEVDHLAYLTSTRVQLARQTAQLKGAQNVVANADTYRLQARNSELEQQLRDLQAERTERGLVMTLGDVLFATGRAELSAGAQERVDRLAGFMRQYPERSVRIEGYTDSTGSADANLTLSERRAQSVRDALVLSGVQPNRIVTQGFGAAQPVASNATSSGRQQNRRVEIVISEPGTVAETPAAMPARPPVRY